MIKSELIKDPCDLYIKHSVTLDLDTLEVLHQKLTNARYTEIEYRFSARRTNYTCNKAVKYEPFSLKKVSRKFQHWI